MAEAHLKSAKDFYFQIARTFDVPIDRVWRAWTNAEQLQTWFGPKGFDIMENSLNLQAGGIYHYGLKTPQGEPFWGLWRFLEVQKEQRLVFIMSFADANAEAVGNPWSDNWPLYTHSTVTFEAKNDQTTVTITAKPYEASNVECETFFKGAPSMKQGWTGTFDQLEGFLE